MSEERNHIRVFVSSTVYDFETVLRGVFSTLDGFGYDVYMSKEGTIPLNSRYSNLVNCTKGVEECHVFLGIVRPLQGTGILKKGERSITAQEFDKALELDMPRFILADYRVEFAHKFLNLMDTELSKIPLCTKKTINEDGREIIKLKPNDVIHGECVEIYRAAIKDQVRPATDRTGNWAQPFKDWEDIQRFIEAQFKDVERIKQLIHGE